MPELTYFERENTRIPFRSYTLIFKGLLLYSQGKTKDSLLSLYEAEEVLRKERELLEEERERMKKIILAFRARVHREGEKKDADESILLAERTEARTRLECDAERIALIARIQAAIGEGDYELAHNLAEKLNLKAYSATVEKQTIQVHDPARKEAVDQMKAFKDQIAQLDKELARLEAGSKNGKDSAAGVGEKNVEKLAELRELRLNKQREFKKFVVGLKRSHPEVVVLLGAQPMEVSMLQQNLGEKTAIVQYLVTDETVWIFLITENDISISEVPVSQKDYPRM